MIQPTGGLGSGDSLLRRRFVLPARISLLTEARRQFTDYLAQIGVESTAADMLELGFTEALANAIKHGCAGDDSKSVTLEWWNDDSSLTLAVSHEGEGPPQDVFETSGLPDDPLATSGRGFFLMRQLFDDCQLWRSSTGVRIELKKSFDSLGRGIEDDDEVSLILEELSHSYESLAAFQRMGNALITSKRTGDFLEEGLASLRQIHGTRQPEVLWLCLSDAVLDAVQLELNEVEGVRVASTMPALVGDVLASGDSFLWRSTAELKNFDSDQTFADFSHGCVFPIMAQGEALGCLVTALQDSDVGFEASEINNLRTFTDLFGIALANANMQTQRRNETRAVRELELAAEIQKMLLPVSTPPESDQWKVFMQHRSAQEVAGDYLEACHDEQGNLVMTVIDVMGKGVSAAMLASVYRTAFLMNLGKTQPLNELAQSLNQVLASTLGEMSSFVTCALVRIDPNFETMEIVNAGHCPVLTFNCDGVLDQIEPSGPPLGILEDSEYEVEQRGIAEHQGVLLVTDGMFEWRHDGSWWGWERFVELAGRKTFADPVGFWNDIQTRIGVDHGELHDDQTLLFWRREKVVQPASNSVPTSVGPRILNPSAQS